MQLQGVRVVDLTRILSGPFCSLLLADMGAEVIKVEPPGGDPLRGQGAIVEGLSWYFAAFNRNKRSVLLNLRRASGRAALRRLIATADVVVDNFRPGVMADLGLDWSELSKPAARHHPDQCHRIRGAWSLCRAAVVRLHCSGDERLYEL